MAPLSETGAGLDGADLEAADRVATLLPASGRLGVAFSGGVDSSVLLALAARALGRDRVLAVLGVSASLPAEERTAAHEVAAVVGVPVVEVATHEGEREGYRRNGPDRCFHCKDELFSRISDEVVDQHGLVAVAYGENLDDARRPDRPGARAATAHAVLRPLADAGLDKAAVRRLAHTLALPCADKPAAPCLASRIPHFSKVVPEKLRQVELAEAGLRRLGFTDLRVRHHGDIARLELPPADLPRAVAEPTRAAIRRPYQRRVSGTLPSISPVCSQERSPSALCRPNMADGPNGAGGPQPAWRPPEPLVAFAELDHDRVARRGFPEAVYCAGKTAGQVRAIAAEVGARRSRTLFTRADPEHAQAVLTQLPDARYDAAARLLAWPADPPPATGGLVVVVAAGTSDLPVAREAELTCTHLGRRCELVVDVGVAGLHRVLGRLELLRSARVVVVVAGMEGALPSVVAGLVAAPVVAVPTSVGYGASFGGLAALLGMLNTCAPGVAVVNIDNGYGAGHLAAQIAGPVD